MGKFILINRVCHLTVAWALLMLVSFEHALAYQPVIVTSTIGDDHPETNKALIETLSEAMQTGFLKALAREYYGTGPAFQGQASSSPLSLWLDMQRAIDQEIDQGYVALIPKLKIPAKGRSATKVDVFWTKEDFSSPALPLLQNGLGALMGFTQGAGFNNVMKASPFAFQLGRYALSTQLVNEDDVGGMMRMYGTVGQAYRDIAAAHPEGWQPVHASTEMSLGNDGGLTVAITILLIPSEFHQESDPKPDTNYTMSQVRFNPFQRPDENVGLQLRFQRTYGGKSPTPPFLNVKFGLFGDSILFLTSCTVRDCAFRMGQLPTFDVKVHGSWFENLGASLAGVSEFRFMINDIRINLNTMKVMEQGTSIPILVTDRHGRRHVYDTLHSGGGVFARMIRTMIGGRLRAGIADELSGLESKFEAELMAKLGSLSGLWSDD